MLVFSGVLDHFGKRFTLQSKMNAIGIIAPYKYEGMWVFDDPAVGLVREPFVAGIDKMIDQLVASIPEA